MTAAIELHGTCDERFRGVREAFQQNFEQHGDVGASLCLIADGKIVVDIWGGFANAAQTVPWQRDTICNTYSTTKGITAVCAHRLVESGALDLDAPVAKYWPEFGANGKAQIPVRYLLSHQAGLPAVRKPLPFGTLYNWQAMTEALAEEAPWWEPGTRHGYHAVTFGFLVGEVIRRASGMTVGEYLRKELAGPLGIDFHIGIGPELEKRVAEMIPVAERDHPLSQAIADPSSMTFKAFLNPPDAMIPGTVNSPAWRAAEIPAANGHGNAHSLARLYGALATDGLLDGKPVLSKLTIDVAGAEQVNGEDAVILLSTRFGLGFMLDLPDYQISPSGTLFGHPGLGGSIGFADPVAGIGFGYTMNRMILPENMVDPRWQGMLDAVYGAL